MSLFTSESVFITQVDKGGETNIIGIHEYLKEANNLHSTDSKKLSTDSFQNFVIIIINLFKHINIQRIHMDKETFEILKPIYVDPVCIYLLANLTEKKNPGWLVKCSISCPTNKLLTTLHNNLGRK